MINEPEVRAAIAWGKKEVFVLWGGDIQQETNRTMLQCLVDAAELVLSAKMPENGELDRIFLKYDLQMGPGRPVGGSWDSVREEIKNYLTYIIARDCIHKSKLLTVQEIKTLFYASGLECFTVKKLSEFVNQIVAAQSEKARTP